MNLLVVDTCLAACQAAVLAHDGRIVVRSEAMERGQQERLAGLVAETMDEAGLAFGRIDRIGVTVGPGSFTGLRVGLAFAKGLGIALGCEMVGIGALPALAAGRGGLIAAVLDARRDQVHLQVFEEGAPITAPEAIDIAQAVSRLRTLGAGHLVGGGAGLVAESGWTDLSIETPDIAEVARLVAAADPAASPPAPLYLRGAYA